MLDINLIREKTADVKKALLKRMKPSDLNLEEILRLDKKYLEILQKLENLRAEKNKASKTKPTLEIIERMKRAGEEIKKLDEELKITESELHEKIVSLPNLPDEDVKPGGKENNEVIKIGGKKPEFRFNPQDHLQLVNSLGLVDYERGVKMGGSGFWLYKGDGALMEWALLNFFIEQHIKNGYEFILPPHILNYECGFTAGQFPKFADDVFQIKTEENKLQFLLPTAETALVNFHRDEILDEKALPKKYFSYTPCYRKEAGSYRSEERGMIRGHQFNKVEIFQYTKPEDSDKALEEMIKNAEKIVQELDLHYRISKLAAGDCSAGMAKTYDIEVWIPSMKEYKEVSSASNARDYQARRGNMKYRAKNGEKKYLHTLNASGLATSRILPAIVEQFQQKDGSVVVPKVLRRFVGKKMLVKSRTK